MRRLAKWFGWVFVAELLGLLAFALLTARTTDPALWPPPPAGFKTEISLVSYAYHAGLVIPRLAARERASQQNDHAVFALTERFAGYPWLEIGWGDERFYRMVPTIASLTISEAFRALFGSDNPSVLHVVGLLQPAQVSFASSDIVRIELSQAGFGRLLDGMDASFARGRNGAVLDDVGPGIYGPSRFYRGNGNFSIFNDCNHWVARLLSDAGLPTAPVLATLPQGLLLDLRWRAGLVPMLKAEQKQP
jgi:uncharacterized protein (TIGR02117 family)